MYQSQPKLIKIICLFSLFLFSALGMALDSDKNQPATLKADNVKYNRDTNIGIYTGNVSINQGTTVITANQITTYSDKQNHLIKAIAVGVPATYQSIPQANQGLLKASALTITYFPAKNTVILQGTASVTQNNNVINGPWISYNLKTGQMITQQDQSHQQQTTIIYQPKPGSSP